MKNKELTALEVENIQKAIFTNDITALGNLIADKVNLNVLTKVADGCYYRSPLNFTIYHNDISIFRYKVEGHLCPEILDQINLFRV